MKMMIGLLLIAIAGRSIFEANLAAQTLAPQALHEKQSIYAMADIGYGRVTFSGGVAGNWLTVQRLKPYEPDGYNPSFTFIISDYKPIVRKMENGKYEISFTSDIADKLP